MTLTVPTEQMRDRRLLGAARARVAVPDLRSGDDPAASDAGRPLHPRSVPGQHHSGRAASARSRGTSSGSIRCPTRRAPPTAPTTTPTRPRWRSRPTTRPPTRVDHNLSDRHRVYGRFSWDFWEEEKDNRFDNLATGIFLNRKNRVFALDDAYTIKSNLLINVRGGFTRQLFPERRRSQGFDLASLGFSDALASLVPRDLATFPNVDVRRLSAVRPLGVGRRLLHDRRLQRHRHRDLAARQPQPEVRHRIPPLRRALEPLSDRGVPDASRSATRGRAGPLDNSAAAPRGQDLASFLLGYPTGGSMSRAAEYKERSGVLGLYAHNDWRVRNNLTLNLGLRWEYEGPLTEAENRMISGFDFDTPLPIADAVRAELRAQPDRGSSGGRLPGPRRRALSRYRRSRGRLGADVLTNFMPRAGFSWQPIEKIGGSRRLRAVLRRARPQPHQRQPDRLLAGDRPDAVARQRPDVRRHAGQSVPGRPARAGRQRPRADDERRPGRQLPVRGRRPDAAHPSLVAGPAARAAVELPGRRHLRRLVLAEHPGLARAEPDARPLLLDARRCATTRPTTS